MKTYKGTALLLKASKVRLSSLADGAKRERGKMNRTPDAVASGVMRPLAIKARTHRCGSIRDELHQDRALTRAVELGQEYPLPGTQHQRRAFHEDIHTGADQTGLDMGM